MASRDPESAAWCRGALRAGLVPEFTPRRWRRFLDRGGLPHELASSSGVPPARLGDLLGIGRSAAASLAHALARADPEDELAAAARAGAEVLAWGSAGYPTGLDALADPPPVLFVRGGLLPCDAGTRAVAIIGSRRASPYGLRVARALAGDLGRAGITIVSGLARGIDAAAHQGALDAGGRTLAVLGSGLLEPYPPEHVDLLERIATTGQGAVVSEFPLRAPPRRRNFPRRNRVLAALCTGLVVVEAGTRSGALGTVGHALDLGRVVMAVPGPVDSETSRGTLRLLQEGAAAVGSAQGVFAALGWCTPPRSQLPEMERAVLDAVHERGCTAEEAARAAGLPVEAAAGYLVTLEVRGMVQRGPEGRYATM